MAKNLKNNKPSKPNQNIQPIKEGGKGWSEFEAWAGIKWFAEPGSGVPKAIPSDKNAKPLSNKPLSKSK